MIKNNSRYIGIFWFFLMLLPLIVFLISYWSTGTTVSFFEFSELFAFAPVKTALDSCFGVAFGTVFPMSAYFSWLVFLEIARLLVDVLTFIPRFARGACERFSDIGGKR